MKISLQAPVKSGNDEMEKSQCMIIHKGQYVKHGNIIMYTLQHANMA